MNYECESCNYKTDRINNLKKHNSTSKHTKNMNNVNLCHVIKTSNNLNGKHVSINKTHQTINNNKNNIVHNTNNKLILNNEAMNIVVNAYHDDTDVQNESAEKKYICDCMKKFSHKQSLCRHKKTCNFINNNLEFSEEMNKLKTELVNCKNELKKAQSVTIINGNVNNTNVSNNNITNTINNKSMNVYTYINGKYTTAPPLKTLNQYDVVKLLTNVNSDHTIEELMVFHYEKNMFEKFVGDIIVQEYKKEDPTSQQIWSSDISRLVFIVRRILDKDENVWNKDKNGICLLKSIISPLLEESRKMLIVYVKQCQANIPNVPIDDAEKLHDNIGLSVQIIYEINAKELHTKILKYIAPYFQLDISGEID